MEVIALDNIDVFYLFSIISIAFCMPTSRSPYYVLLLFQIRKTMFDMYCTIISWWKYIVASLTYNCKTSNITKEIIINL